MTTAPKSAPIEFDAPDLMSGALAVGIGVYLAAVVINGNIGDLGTALKTETGYLEFLIALFVLSLLASFGPTSEITQALIVVALIVIFAIIVAPVCEELFFRGFAYPALKQRWGIWVALTTVSAAFAVIHLHLPSLGPLFALAIGLGLSYELTGSLLAPITMHALFNAANVAVLLYVRAHS